MDGTHFFKNQKSIISANYECRSILKLKIKFKHLLFSFFTFIVSLLKRGKQWGMLQIQFLNGSTIPFNDVARMVFHGS